MPPKKLRPDEDTGAFTVRTELEHREVFDEVRAHFGLSRSDFVALVMACACGLDVPKGTPTVPIKLDELRKLASAALARVRTEREKRRPREQEVLRPTG
ncbi:hypothetical protein GCM10012275_64430 [Longimycelium tulufanense]|uniref:Uncharacterized protein n=2 Tax=Longimycelium tulufanense TaxID=907463 RepID=A0A8J3FYU6_9PSEU|nr:hypothetical protein GCM10012275_64430 [Longimycelium tulufanense]